MTDARTPHATRWRWAAPIAALALLLAPTHPAAAQEDDPALDQTIDADEAVASGDATIALGHVDLGPRLIDGEWQLLIRDDSVVPSVWRHLDEAVIRVSDAAVTQVPDDPTYDFLGVESGASVHVVPQTQDPEVVWLGWNTQDPEVLERLDRGMTLSLVGVDGPGELVVYLQSGNLSEPDVLWSTEHDEAEPLFVDVNTHTHANWVFTEPGTYLLKLRADGALVDGTEVTDEQVVRFAVGDQTSDAAALEASYEAPDRPDPADEAQAAGSDEGDGDATADGSSFPWAAIVGIVVVALLLAVAVVAWRGAQARRRSLGEDREVAGSGRSDGR